MPFINSWPLSPPDPAASHPRTTTSRLPNRYNSSASSSSSSSVARPSDPDKMAQPPFSTSSQPHRPSPTAGQAQSQSQNGFAAAAMMSGNPGAFERENTATANHLFSSKSYTPASSSSSSSSSPVGVLIRRLPLNTEVESLRLMLVWSHELVDMELLPPDESQDEGFRSAIVRFQSINGASEAKNMLHGRVNVSNNAAMIVEILHPQAATAMASPSNSASLASSAAPGGPSSISRHNFPSPASFLSMENKKLSPSSLFAVREFVPIYPPQPPIGNHLNHDRGRLSSKSLIAGGDYNDDEDTSNLLRDPLAYVENSALFQRRATAPQIPVGRMANLHLHTTTNASNSSSGSSSLPKHTLSPVGSTPGLAYNPAPAGGQHFPPRHNSNFPAANPADQNPPCNTLYVGNLPIDTSEEELKAMFSKQRGYKRLCFRTKQNGPMCFVEFEDISFATKALHDLYGHPLHNSVKGGIRLSFSKNPLGVRSGQLPTAQSSGPPPGQVSSSAAAAAAMQMNTAGGVVGAGHGAIYGGGGAGGGGGPPPGLSAPPGLGNGHGNFATAGLNPNLVSSYHGGNAAGASQGSSWYPPNPNPNPSPRNVAYPVYPGASNNPWNTTTKTLDTNGSSRGSSRGGN